MGRVRVLPDRVANQIAAGEVVERPASVCKELIENSLDAGATQLRIELGAGGRSLIKVGDNGSGMGRDDAMLAFERHATSKLRTADDLLGVGTLGFRGEALPSIASVSRLTLRTRAADETSGTAVVVHGGRMRDVRDAAMAPGTTVSVRNLFFNVPARRKFLRTKKTELGHAVRMATHYSLAHVDKAFHLRNEHRVLLSVTPVAALRERVYQIFGRSILDSLVELKPGQPAGAGAGGAGPDGPSLAGFVSEPQTQRSNRNSIHVFVNRRLVRDRLMQRAISAAYESMMPKGVYPFVLLFLDLPPSQVDVNVHPAKTEVRFRNPSAVFECVREGIRGRLVAAKPASSLPAPRTTANHGIPAAPPQPMPVGPAPFSNRRSGPHPPPAPGFPFGDGPRPPAPSSGPAQPVPDSVAPPPSAPAPAGDGMHSRAPLVERAPASLGSLGELRLLGQVHDSFIVAAGEDGVWIIDQHVAHERILYEKVLDARLQGKPIMQGLLVPVILDLTPDRMVAYQQIAEEFSASGFEIERYGGRAIAVQAAPAELRASQVEALIHEILDASRDGGSEPGLAGLRKRMAATIACHAAIKVNMPLAPEKMRWLLEELARTQCPMSCPHGRPIALRYGTEDILRAFHRI